MRNPLPPATRLFRILTLGCALVIGGCGVLRESCNLPQRYEKAESAPPLKIPEGLTPPNTKNSLVIPDVATERRKLTPKDACRDAPPAFFDDKVLPAR